MRTRPVVELPSDVHVVNIGLPLFETSVRDQGVPAIGVDWRIPGDGTAEVVAVLSRLLGPKSEQIDRANADVVTRLNDGVPTLMAIDRAGAVVPGMGERCILHCGPAIAWNDMCDPLQRSIKAAIVAEGWAADTAAAERLVTAGEVEPNCGRPTSTRRSCRWPRRSDRRCRSTWSKTPSAARSPSRA